MVRSRSLVLALWFLLAAWADIVQAQRIETLADFDAKESDATSRLPWLIELRSPSDSPSAGEWENLDSYIERVQEELANEMGWRNLNDIVRYESVPMMAKALDRAEADRLLRSDKVAALYRSEWRDTFLSESTRLVGAQPLIGGGSRGEGQVVAVLDTGVDDTHPFLQGKVVDGACFSVYGNCPGGAKRASGLTAGRPTLGNDHGTHVAGIIAGSDRARSGVAPAAKLLAVQVFSRAEGRVGATDVDVLAALDWVYAQRANHRIAAVNLSLGGGAFNEYCDGASPYTAILRLLRQAGIVAVIASGNDSQTSAVASPACVSVALSVGSTDKQGNTSPFSNSWPKLNFVAPGGDIESSVLAGGFAAKSGTSMAAPHVAGAIALLRAARPQAGAEDAILALSQGGVPHRDARTGVSSVLISIEQALRLMPLPAPVPPNRPEPAPPEARPAPPTVPVAPTPPVPAPRPQPTPAPTPAPPVAPAPSPKPPPRIEPRPDASLPLCEENIDGIAVSRQPPCRKGH